MKNKIIPERSKIDTYYFQIKGKTVINYQLAVSSCLDSQLSNNRNEQKSRAKNVFFGNKPMKQKSAQKHLKFDKKTFN